jgi:hypothetical protein
VFYFFVSHLQDLSVELTLKQKISTPEGPYVPTGGISQADGLALIKKLDAGLEVIAELSTEMAVSTTYNVIAQTKGGDQNNVIHIGGHSDSVAAGPGINDNGCKHTVISIGIGYYIWLKKRNTPLLCAFGGWDVRLRHTGYHLYLLIFRLKLKTDLNCYSWHHFHSRGCDSTYEIFR